MRHAPIATALIATALFLLAPLAQAESIPLRQGLTLTSSVTGPEGAGSRMTTVTAITPRLVKLAVTGKQADGSALSSSRNVRVQDLQSARSIRPGFAEGKTELFENSTAIGTSALVLGELKTGGSTLSLDVGGLSMKNGLTGAGVTNALDGMLEGMGGFAGISEALEAAGASGVIDAKDLAEGQDTMGAIGKLQMVEGLLKGTGKTTVQVLVNGQKTALPGIVAKGRLGEAYDTELVFLDDPANPLLLKSRIGDETSQVTRIDYPVLK